VTIRFVEEARQELLDAISHYEKIRVGLGARFKDELDRCVLWIADHAGLYRKRQVGYRRINLRVFPYYVPYIVRSETLWVLAIAYAGRKPLYWISRQSQAGGHAE
jgi:plasmid stabilization system protein ParE